MEAGKCLQLLPVPGLNGNSEKIQVICATDVESETTEGEKQKIPVMPVFSNVLVSLQSG